MKMAKSYKLIFIIVAFVAALSFALGLIGFSSAKADTVNASSFITYNGRTAAADDAVIDTSTNKLNVKLYEGSSVSFKNALSSNDLSIKFTYPSNTDVLKFTFIGNSYDVNGNEIVSPENTEYKTEIESVLSIDSVLGKVSFNNSQTMEAIDAGDEVIVRLVKVGKQFSAYVNGSLLENSVDDNKYLMAGYDIIAVNVKIEADLADNHDGEVLAISSVNQAFSGGEVFSSNKYVQNFETEDGAIKNIAYPVIEVENWFQNGGTNDIKELGIVYTPSLKGYCLLGNFVAGNYSFASDDASLVVNGNTIAFTSTGIHVLQIKKGDESMRDISVNVYDGSADSDDVAPVYETGVLKDNLINSFTAKYEDLLYDEDGATKVAIGSNQYLSLNKSMFRSMVKDNFTAFEDLTAKIYYSSETNSGSASDFRIPLKEAGHYEFYVLFTDRAGNEMEANAFFYKDAVNPDLIHRDEPYSDYIFEFDIVDTSRLTISASTAGTGYVGALYNASAFTIDATFGYTDSYKLFYCASYDKDNPDSSEWKEIAKLSDATDKEKDYDGFTYDEIKSIAYDGKLSFTPNKTGFYKIEVGVTSDSSTKSGSESMVIEVKNAVKTVKVDTHWIQNNIWSVVFLSVGTLCLIGIVILLFIKPKDEDDDTTDVKGAAKA